MKSQKIKNTDIEYLTTDILVIGAGGAGLRAAIEAHNNGAKVLIITKEYMGGAHTSMADGGINVAIKKPATPELHYQDTINGGWKINNYKMAKIFAYEMPDRIHDLEKYGVQFDRLPDGSLYTWKGGKQSAPLNLCAGDYTGLEMMRGLVEEIKRLKIPYLDDHFVTKIFKKNGKIIGAFVIDLNVKSKKVITAKVTIIATGGGGMMYLYNTNAESNTGEGYAWALDAGAKLIDMEMIQFHPTGSAHPKRRGRLVTEKVRGHGGILRNNKGDRFMMKYQPQRLELAGRDEVARAIYQEVKEGRGTKNGGVYLDTTHWDKGAVEKHIPDVFKEHMEIGVDIRKDMMEVYPSMHHMMGGIEINEWGETNVDGLFACGEVSRSIHGANRLGGNSIAEGQVFGRRTGIESTKYSKKVKILPIPQTMIDEESRRLSLLLSKKRGKNVKKTIRKLQELMWHKAGLIRNKQLLTQALSEIKNLQNEALEVIATNKKELISCLELQEMVKTAEAIVIPALLRTESRGAHFRADYPEMDPKWEKNIEIFKDKQGKLKTKIVNVVK